MAYSIEWEELGVVWNYFGKVTGDDLQNSNQDIYGDERFDNMEYQIVDLTAVQSFNICADDVAELAAKDNAAALSNPMVKVAVVAPNEKGREMSVMYESATDHSPWKHKIFETLEQARQWIDS